MQSILKQSLIISLFAGAILFLGSLNASAQTGGACEVTSAVFRTTRTINAAFYDDNNRPYVYIDIETQNCAGQTIEVSITEEDPFGDDDVNGTLGAGQTCNNSNNTCMDNRVIQIPPSEEVTLSLIAGTDECEWNLNDPDCDYHIETWDDVNSGQEWHAGLALNYECNGGCLENWAFQGLLTNFEGTDVNDPDLQGNNNGGGGGGGTPIPPPNTSTTAGGTNTIDLGLTNPLEGTIDTIPQLLQKIVEIFIKIGIPLVAIAILYSGFLFVTARGNENQIKTARQAFTFAIIGGLILLASWLVADAIRDALLTIN